MTRIEYDLIRADRPDLILPPFEELPDRSKIRLCSLSRNRMIANRVYVMLMRDNPRQSTAEDDTVVRTLPIE